MNVETGSLTSEIPTIDEAESTAAPFPTSAINSPLSSPIVEATLIDEEAVPPALDIPPSVAGGAPLKSGLDGLKAPVRSGSAMSVSSMAVETGSVASQEGAESTTTEDVVPSVVGDEEAISPVVSGGKTEAEEEQLEQEKKEQTQKELDEYEKEDTDVTVPPEEVLHITLPKPTAEEAITMPAIIVPESPVAPVPVAEDPGVEVPVQLATLSPPALSTLAPLNDPEQTMPRSVTLTSLQSEIDDSVAPVSASTSAVVSKPEEPTQIADILAVNEVEPAAPIEEKEDEEQHASYSSYLDDYANDDEEKQRAATPVSPGMPQVKCSDCQRMINLMELADHSCDSSALPPAISSHPSSPAASIKSPPMSPSVSRMLPDAAEGTTPAVQHGMTRSASTSSSKFSQKMDAFVAQTSSLVPDDVSDDEFADRPQRPAGDDLDSPMDPVGIETPRRSGSSSRAPQQRRPSFDLPEDISAYDDLDAAPHAPIFTQKPATTPTKGKDRIGRSLSGNVGYGTGSPLRGFDDDSDEEGYEGGSVTIVRRGWD
ncbi:hypothetical protein MNV49_001524 [Pseudohyphozyma bogoriensis]|nr:hypothetical protein MNV49_001524 [Pseudohyphozyma bogoriensis]